MDSETEPKTVGERIKYLREKKGETQEKLGDAVGLSQKSISNIENGITPLALDNQIRIAEYFNVSHDYLCTGRNNDSILKLLEKYVSLKYTTTSNGIESFDYPVLQINKVFFDYLIRSARAQNDRYMPDDVRELWIEKEVNTFYKLNKDNTLSKFESIVPLPQQLIYPDDQKSDWKQTDLLREMNNQLLHSSNKKDRSQGE